MNIRQTISSLQAKTVTLDKLSSKDLFFVTKYYWDNKNDRAMQACREQAEKNLITSGWQWCQGIGWCKTKDIPNMGIGLKFGKWLVIDRRKYNAFNTPADMDAKYVTEYNNKLI